MSLGVLFYIKITKRGEKMLEKSFNQISIVLGVVGGVIASYLGGWDMMLQTIVILTFLDYCTGVLKAIYKKELSSSIGYQGIIKKFMMFLVICAAHTLQATIGDQVPLREITIMFFIANEGISLLENAAELIPIPTKIKEILIQIREKEGE